jgi:hypothetical protein
MSYFITSIMIIHFIYAETVYMNMVTFCIEKCILMFVETFGFEPGIL